MEELIQKIGIERYTLLIKGKWSAKEIYWTPKLGLKIDALGLRASMSDPFP
jgi:hypothetical protein